MQQGNLLHFYVTLHNFYCIFHKMAFISKFYFILLFSNTTQDFVYNVLQFKYQPCCLKVNCKLIQHNQLLWHYNQNVPNGS